MTRCCTRPNLRAATDGQRYRCRSCGAWFDAAEVELERMALARERVARRRRLQPLMSMFLAIASSGPAPR